MFKKFTYLFFICLTLIGCDLKPIDYTKRIRRSSFVRAGSTQTGRLKKSHSRMGVSTSKNAFKKRIYSRGYYSRNRHRRRLRGN